MKPRPTSVSTLSSMCRRDAPGPRQNPPSAFDFKWLMRVLGESKGRGFDKSPILQGSAVRKEA